VLVGRTTECAVVEQLVRQAGSSGGVLMIRGEPGVGKSSLLEHAQSAAGSVPMLRTTGVESESELTYAGLHGLLHPVLHRLGELPEPQAEALAWAFGLRTRGAGDRFLVSLGALGVLSAAATDTGLLCVVDDAQWLDGASADAILFAARRLEADGVVFILAARDDDAADPVGAGLPELRLEGLAPDVAGDLVSRTVDPRVRDQLVASTGGNPLALLEVPRILTPEQLAGTEPLPHPLPVGEQVSRAFLHSMRTLSDDAHAMVLLVATDDTQDRRTIDDAADLLGIDRSALDELEAAQLVVIRDVRVAMRHPLARSAVYGAAGERARQRTHGALASVLTGERSTWHRAAVADASDTDIAHDLEAVAVAARGRTAHATAAAAFERAALLTPDPATRGRRLAAAAASSWEGGRTDRVRPLLEQALPLLEPTERAGLGLIRGDLALERGRPADAFELFVTAAGDLADRDPAFALRMLARAAEATWWLGAAPMSTRLQEVARGLASAGDSAAELIAHLVRGSANMFTRDFAAGAADLREVLHLAERVGAEVGMTAGYAAVWLGAPFEGRAWFTRVVSRLRAESNLRELPFALSQLAAMDVWLGDLSDGAAHVHEALQLARATGQDRSTGHASVTLATLHALRGDETAARASAHDAVVSPIGGSALQTARASWAIGRLELALGRPDLAVAHLNAVATPGDGSSHPLVALLSTADLVEAEVRLDHIDQARSAYAQYEPWAHATAAPWALSMGARMRALLAGDDAEAEASFQEALRLGEGLPFDQARNRLLHGEALRRLRRRTQARTELRSAHAAFEAIGARPWAERARVELRAAGEIAAQAATRSVDTLTPQELEISRLAAQGSTNRDIATRLFLSVRTIEYHLHKVFTKLGITSRHALAPLVLDDLVVAPDATQSSDASPRVGGLRSP
jgi:DNA-binding CsgD family transcriptional regulator